MLYRLFSLFSGGLSAFRADRPLNAVVILSREISFCGPWAAERHGMIKSIMWRSMNSLLLAGRPLSTRPSLLMELGNEKLKETKTQLRWNEKSGAGASLGTSSSQGELSSMEFESASPWQSSLTTDKPLCIVFWVKFALLPSLIPLQPIPGGFSLYFYPSVSLL